MKTRLMQVFLGVLCAFACSGIALAHTFHVATHGTLEQIIDTEMLTAADLNIKELVVTGQIDGKDLAYIRKAEGYLTNMKKLDLSQVEIVPTNDTYAQEEYNPMGLMYPDVLYLYFADEPYTDVRYFMTGQNQRQAIHIHTNDLRYMFKGMTKVQEIRLPDQVKAFGASIFDGCTALQSVAANCVDLNVIPERAFYGCENLNLAMLPPTVESIGDMAFYGCKSFTGNLVLNNVKEIGTQAFHDNSFTSITISSPYITEIKDGTFAQYDRTSTFSLETVNLSEATSLKKIGSSAFNENRNLRSCSLPEGLYALGYRAFFGCRSLTEMNLPSSLVQIGSDALGSLPTTTVGDFLMTGSILRRYNGSYDVTELTIPEGTTVIMDNAMGNFKKLASLTLPEGLRSIGEACFCADQPYNNPNITIEELVIPSTVEHIGRAAFVRWNNLASVTLPESLKSIDEAAFQGCTSLTQITIPESVERIGGKVFDGCTGLARVTYKAIDAVNTGGTPFNGCTGIKQFWFGDKVKTIPNNLCYELNNVTELTLPASVENVGDYAFYMQNGYYGQGNTNLTTVPTPLKEVGKNAFGYCRGLTSVPLAEGLESIGEGAFTQCSALASITIPASVKEIGEYAFSGCENLKSVHISDLSAWCRINLAKPRNGSYYYDNGLYYADGLYLNGELLSGIVIPEDITVLGRAFACYKGMKSIRIHDKLTRIEESAFLNCSNLQAVHISDLSAWCNIDFAATTSFSNTNPLVHAQGLYLNGELVTDVAIPEGSTEVKAFIFEGYKALKTVSIPEGVKRIGYYAFGGCRGLESAALPSSLEMFAEGAFYNTGLKGTVTIPASVTTLGPNAFYYTSVYDFVLEGENPPAFGNGAIDYLSKTDIHVPATAISDYANATGWGHVRRILGFQDCLGSRANSFCNGLDGTVSNDAKVYTFAYIKDGKVYGEQVQDNAVIAGNPYIIVPNESVERITFTPNDHSATPETHGNLDANGAMQAVLDEDCDADTGYKTVMGSGYIVFTTKGLRLANDSYGTRIKKGKCYINSANAFSTAANSRAKAIGKYLEDATGIDSASSDKAECGQGYGLNGMKSDGRGVVIYNGKKLTTKK